MIALCSPASYVREMLPTAIMENSLAELAWIDIVGLVLVGGSLVLGIFCGLWWQIIRLVGLVGAVLLARGLSPSLAPLLEEAAPSLGPRYAAGVVWLSVFVLGLIAATLLPLFAFAVTWNTAFPVSAFETETTPPEGFPDRPANTLSSGP